MRIESKLIIAPSLLAADFSNLEKQIKEIESAGADWLHLDIMDGHFVPNITFGAPIVNVIRKCTKLPLDIHLMVEEPEKYIKYFQIAGADLITVHQETCTHLYRTIIAIKDYGCKAGVSINPSTPVDLLKDIVENVDLILIMTVEPGFGGQKFIKSTLSKIQAADTLIKKAKNKIYLEVDGGINIKTARYVVKAGANVLVAGTSVFKSKSIKRTITSLRATSQK